uniref:tRNA synthetases class I catalytic domain-containing protein n=1 Tax=Heterorhabditis bacteriophora TaxID=37862 RepID=A0A1I7WN64_HETBA
MLQFLIVLFDQNKYNDELDADKKKMYEIMIKKVDDCAQALEKALTGKDSLGVETAKGQLLNEARDVLSEWLDAKHGKEIIDHSVFDSLAKTYENEFLADMARLHVLPADVLTRVSEYVPEVVKFVEKIIKNGYAYSTDDGSQKRNPTDFALWKSSKDGEPFWDSPWGKAGMKMSKSLKNFITIREALKQYTARQLRLLFLMHNWTDVLDYRLMMTVELFLYLFFVILRFYHYCYNKKSDYRKKLEKLWETQEKNYQQMMSIQLN